MRTDAEADHFVLVNDEFELVVGGVGARRVRQKLLPNGLDNELSVRGYR
jgi:hypothetical protein